MYSKVTYDTDKCMAIHQSCNILNQVWDLILHSILHASNKQVVSIDTIYSIPQNIWLGQRRVNGVLIES